MARGMARKDPDAAAVLSFLVPGVGQLYNRDPLRALFWLVVTPGLWLGSGGFLGWVCHFAAAWTAHRRCRAKVALGSLPG
jgi:TM2 domain-containing membrane protein YozV